MSGPIKITDNRRPIVEPGGFVWPWSNGGRDLDLGQSAQGGLTPPVEFKTPTIEIGPEKKQRRPRQRRSSPAVPMSKGATGLFGALAGLIVAFFLLLHGAPHLTHMFGLGDLFYGLVETIPQGDLIAGASRAWGFDLAGVWIITLIIRVVAFNMAKKEPQGALMTAGLAAVVDAVTWFAVGRERPGDHGALLILLALELLLTVGLVALSGVLAANRRRTAV